MCFGPSFLGGGAKTRLESRTKKFTPRCICRQQNGYTCGGPSWFGTGDLRHVLASYIMYTRSCIVYIYHTCSCIWSYEWGTGTEDWAGRYQLVHFEVVLQRPVRCLCGVTDVLSACQHTIRAWVGGMRYNWHTGWAPPPAPNSRVSADWLPATHTFLLWCWWACERRVVPRPMFTCSTLLRPPLALSTP